VTSGSPSYSPSPSSTTSLARARPAWGESAPSPLGQLLWFEHLCSVIRDMAWTAAAREELADGGNGFRENQRKGRRPLFSDI